MYINYYIIKSAYQFYKFMNSIKNIQKSLILGHFNIICISENFLEPSRNKTD